MTQYPKHKSTKETYSLLKHKKVTNMFLVGEKQYMSFYNESIT